MARDDVDRALTALLDSAGVARAASGRRRRHTLVRQAAESATLSGVLVDLAERRAAARIVLTGGRAHAGVITMAGADVVVLEPQAGGVVLIALPAVARIEPSPPELPAPAGATGDRPPGDVCLVDALAALIEAGEVVLTTSGCPPVPVRIVSVGLDVLEVALASGARAQVAAGAVTDVVAGGR